MFTLTVSEAWRHAYPGAAAGVLAMHGVVNPAHHAALDERKAALEQDLRARYAGCDRAALKALPAIQAYDAYYKQFKKTYHVLLQFESVVMKGKAIPRVAALVEAMFMAELDSLLLTAGHDLEAVQMPLRIDVAGGSERYVRIDGQEQALKADDMMIVDAQGILSSVLYGPDRRTQITPATRQALFTVYAPPGIAPEDVRQHLNGIRDNVLLVAPGAAVESLAVYVAE
jgi:DNA/RNA-binding domain of Phe-tRNA-synthetase-like protein